MRVFHLINHCDLANGNVHVAVDLACAQSQAGHEVAVFSEGGYFEELFARSGVRHIRLQQNLRKPATCILSFQKLLRYGLRNKPDVVHAHMMSGAVIGFALSRLIGCPLVTTVHNSFDRHSSVMRLGDAVVAVSQAETRGLAESGVASRKIHTVLNGCLGSPRYQATSRRGVQSRSPSVMSLCGLHERKGVEDLIHAFALVRDEYPGWSLRIAGEGPDQDNLVALCERLRIADYVAFLGKVDQPIECLKAVEIFVNPSHREPFGLSTIEARAAGCAIIGTNVGGIPETLDGGKAGLLVPRKSKVDLAAALKLLMSDDTLRADFRVRANDNLARFSTDRMMQDYSLVYRKLTRVRAKQLAYRDVQRRV